MNYSESEPIHDAAPTAHERDYLLKRADDHRQLALNAVEPNIRATHLSMQRLYEQRADHSGLMHMD